MFILHHMFSLYFGLVTSVISGLVAEVPGLCIYFLLLLKYLVVLWVSIVNNLPCGHKQYL